VIFKQRNDTKNSKYKINEKLIKNHFILNF